MRRRKMHPFKCFDEKHVYNILQQAPSVGQCSLPPSSKHQLRSYRLEKGVQTSACSQAVLNTKTFLACVLRRMAACDRLTEGSNSVSLTTWGYNRLRPDHPPVLLLCQHKSRSTVSEPVFSHAANRKCYPVF